LRAFHSASANPDLSKRVSQFSKAGLELAVCGNTMKSQHVTLKDLLPGFVAAERGGVVRIAELQSLGSFTSDLETLPMDVKLSRQPLI
jgi:intracellular sulfur oxidation DsrE/DsrF family protein